MSDKLLPAPVPQPHGEYQLQQWQEPAPPLPALARSPLTRPIAAVRRYKWLVMALIVLSVAAGAAAMRFITPQYEVAARILIAADSPMENQSGPIRSVGLLGADDWSVLLKSFTITDEVVRKLSLYLRRDDATKPAFFEGFQLAPGNRFRAGQYELLLDKRRQRWTLSTLPAAVPVDSGGLRDSVGRALGFMWTAPAWAFVGTGEEKFKFTVFHPREMAVLLNNRLTPRRGQESRFLYLTLSDPDRELAARILNTWASEFVEVASQLKRRKLKEFAITLDGQLKTAKAKLDAAEEGLSRFQVTTVTEQQPTAGSPIAAGLQQTNDPVMRNYFDKKLEHDEVKRDIALLRAIIASGSRDSVPTEELLQIRAVSTSPAGQPLRQAVTEYQASVANLTKLRVGYTDAHPQVMIALDEVNKLRTQTIPQNTAQLLASLESRQVDDSLRIASAGVNLQQIPPRKIEEERLRRDRDVSAQIFTDLQNRYAAAQLAELSAAPDVQVLDSAIAPLMPSATKASRLFLIAVVGGIGGAIGLAILLDKFDGRLRYADQVVEDIGLPIAGTVPHFPKGGIDGNSPEQMFQLVESFRSLRMAVLQASRGNGVAIAVSSPSPGEGKSIISANLALSFADGGLRTILVDGDTRRGALHETFGLRNAPGLTEYLAGEVELSGVVQTTSHELLNFVPGGARRRRSPELLTSQRLVDLVAQLRGMYDVVVFDTPPLAAGIDGYCIASATGSLVVVLRLGKTARRMAAEKMQMFERLPVNVVGAVLNDIDFEGAHAYYGYVPGYEATDEAESRDVVKLT